MATVAVGDVHGERAALDDLLAKLLPALAPDDELVFLGDYVDRGPDSRGVIDRLAALRADPPCRVSFLLGNHEEWMLAARRDPTRHSWLLGMGGLETVASYDLALADRLRGALAENGPRLLTERVALPYADFFEEAMPPAHRAFLDSLVAFRRTPEVACVHGGAERGVRVEEQDERSLVWGGAGFPDAYAGPDRLVYGHRNDALVGPDGLTRPRENAHGVAWGIDGIARGALMALRFPDLAVFHGRG